MPSFKTQKTVNVPADVAYAVAADVGCYREFLPLLKSSRVRQPIKQDRGRDCFDAELIVAYDKMNIREGFVSQVVCDPKARTVTAVSNDGPFRELRCIWTITQVSDQSLVSIAIDYKMRNPLIQMALSGVMDMAASKVMAAFEKRALAFNSQHSTSSR